VDRMVKKLNLSVKKKHYMPVKNIVNEFNSNG